MTVQTTKEWLDLLRQSVGNTKSRLGLTPEPFEKVSQTVKQILSAAMKDANRVYWVGNGGSCAICSHLSQDMMNKLGIRSHLFNDPSMMTCMANDYGYENVYARPIATYGEQNDILIAISSSGNSENILNAVEVAKKRQMIVIGLSGFKENNKLWNAACDASFFVSSDLYGIVETGHELILHGIIETLWLKTQNI